jgi:hypothetical protein
LLILTRLVYSHNTRKIRSIILNQEFIYYSVNLLFMSPMHVDTNGDSMHRDKIRFVFISKESPHVDTAFGVSL